MRAAALPARRSAGFTLLELTVALVLLALLSGVLFGSLSFAGRSWDGGEAKAALLDSASGFACTFNETATARRLSVTLAFTTQFIKAARDGDRLTIFGAWRPSTSQSTFAAETEIYDQKGDLVATGAGTFRYLKGGRSDGVLTFLDQKAAD